MWDVNIMVVVMLCALKRFLLLLTIISLTIECGRQTSADNQWVTGRQGHGGANVSEQHVISSRKMDITPDITPLLESITRNSVVIP